MRSYLLRSTKDLRKAKTTLYEDVVEKDGPGRGDYLLIPKNVFLLWTSSDRQKIKKTHYMDGDNHII
jgi:hypothetical protein